MMTHDELTIRIIKLSEDNDENWKFYPALRAVVELHKPILLNEGYVEIGEEPRLTCECDPWNEHEHGYPCPTIQAIEKELA